METNNKLGNVLKCPNCGAHVTRDMGKCPDCGHIFTGVNANSSMEKLAEQLKSASILQQPKIIRNFPIPNSKEDILEFLVAFRAKLNTPDMNVMNQGAYMAKYNECLAKARMLFPDDPDIKPLLVQEEKDTKKKKKASFVGVVLLVLLLAGISVGLYFLLSNESKTKQNIDDELNKLTEQIDKLPAPTEDNFQQMAFEIQKITWTLNDGKTKDRENAIRAFVNKKNAYIRSLNLLGKADPIPEDAVENYISTDDSKKETKVEETAEGKSEIQKLVDDQYNSYLEQIKELPELTVENFNKIEIDLSAIIWSVIADDENSADAKYEATKSNDLKNKMKAQAKKMLDFYNKHEFEIGEYDLSGLENLAKTGIYEN